MNVKCSERLRPLKLLRLGYKRQTRRSIQSSKSKKSTDSALRPVVIPEKKSWSPRSLNRTAAPLSILPLQNIFRTYITNSVFASPILTNACFAILSRTAQAKSSLLNIERNPLLAWLLKHTFYAQFCAGETPMEVKRTADNLRKLGYTGVVLEFALEVLRDKKGVANSNSNDTEAEIEAWRKGVKDTVKLASPGDFVALKWSGLGAHALQLLKNNQPPTAAMMEAIEEVCDLAHSKRVGLFAGAEEEITNVGIESWTEQLQRKYNRDDPGRATVYTTFQTYLRSTPAKIAQHLALAKENGYTFGVKLVRGAYLRMEPTDKVLRSKEETDQAYDSLVESILREKYDGLLAAPGGQSIASFPDVDLVIATHNHPSVRKARTIRDKQVGKGENRIRLSYAQLQGMADEVSCELVHSANDLSADGSVKDIPRTYKNACWGSQRQCLEFLLRRASENKEAATRTEETRRAMGAELRRRFKQAFSV